MAIAGTRDPVMIAKIDSILDGVRAQVKDILQRERIRGELTFHIYGKNAIMGHREPVKKTKAHELGIVIEALGATPEEADALCSLTRSTLLHYGYEGRVSTAGNLAVPLSPADARMGEVCAVSCYHLMPVKDQGIFKRTISNVGGRR